MSLDKVEKRDGSVVDFDKSKIEDAIYKASQAVGKNNREEATSIAEKVTEKLGEIYSEEAVPQVEDIQDIVETTLIEQDRSATAKAYILYRQQRKQKRREKQKLLNKDRVDAVDKQFSLKALRVLSSRYLLRDEEGEITESPRALFERVATVITIPDILRDDKVFQKSGSPQPNPEVDNYLKNFEDYDNSYSFFGHLINQWTFKAMGELYQELNQAGQMKVSFPELLELFEKEEFDNYDKQWEEYYQLMIEQNFLPNSPTLMNAGTRLGQMSACFVLPMEDDMGRIMDSSKDAALIFQSGGGVGINYSKLRPDGDLVASTSGVASGPISFMRIIDTVTDVVKQGGKRRGANMGVLSISHPDIQDFIQAKQEENKFENFNISVGIDEDFWEILNSDQTDFYSLRNPRNGEVQEQVDAKSLLEMIAHSAWESADPGVIFFDQVNKYNVIEPAKGKIRGTNPCGEQPLYEYESCNLGSINLHNFLNQGNFDWDSFEETVRTATRFLDNVLDMNNFPIDQIEQATKQTRKIGLGVMGLANLLYDLEIPYNSGQAYDLMDHLAEALTYTAMDESVELAKQRGPFPIFDETGYLDGDLSVAGYYERSNYHHDWDQLTDKIQKHKIRNGMHTTIAPTGSISMIGDTSNGIEPEFSLAYEKRVTAGDFYYTNDVLENKLKQEGQYSEELLEQVSNNYGSLNGIDRLPDSYKEVFVTAMDIHYSDHLMAQAAWQKWITASISKTINMPNNATMENVFRTYLLAHELGVKGVTVYRDGSKSEQVLNMKGDSSAKHLSSPSTYMKKLFKQEIHHPLMGDQLTHEEQVNSPDQQPDSTPTTPASQQASGPAGQDLTQEECPKCGGQVIHEAGCNKCMECGWSVCTIS